MTVAATLKTYYQLTKPGIIYGNLMTTIAGFLLASQRSVDVGSLLGVAAGTALVIASGCVINNYIDRDIDRHMARTKKRALASGQISARAAITYGIVLGAAGFTLLLLFTNLLTVAVGAVGYFFYLVMYSVWKRRSVYGTLVGSVAGATPITAGYIAAAGQLDGAALLLFLILASWQMPHFYAISLFRRKEYEAAGLPVMSVAKGVGTTKLQILLFVMLFIALTLSLAAFGYATLIYAVVMAAAGTVWLRKGVAGFAAPDTVRWARGMFGFSLLVLLIFSATISINTFLN